MYIDKLLQFDALPLLKSSTLGAVVVVPMSLPFIRFDDLVLKPLLSLVHRGTEREIVNHDEIVELVVYTNSPTQKYMHRPSAFIYLFIYLFIYSFVSFPVAKSVRLFRYLCLARRRSSRYT